MALLARVQIVDEAFKIGKDINSFDIFELGRLWDKSW